MDCLWTSKLLGDKVTGSLVLNIVPLFSKEQNFNIHYFKVLLSTILVQSKS